MPAYLGSNSCGAVWLQEPHCGGGVRLRAALVPGDHRGRVTSVSLSRRSLTGALIRVSVSERDISRGQGQSQGHAGAGFSELFLLRYWWRVAETGSASMLPVPQFRFPFPLLPSGSESGAPSTRRHPGCTCTCVASESQVHICVFCTLEVSLFRPQNSFHFNCLELNSF